MEPSLPASAVAFRVGSCCFEAVTSVDIHYTFLYTWHRRQLSNIPKILNSNCVYWAVPAVFIFMHLHIAFYLLISAVMFLKEKDSLLSFSKESLLRRMLLLWTLREAHKESGSLFEKQKHKRNVLKMIFRSTKGRSRGRLAAFACHARVGSSGMMGVVMTGMELCAEWWDWK